jgi:hypothetical protein
MSIRKRKPRRITAAEILRSRPSKPRRTSRRRAPRHTTAGLIARIFLIVASGCAGLWIALNWTLAPPQNIHDACDIFGQYEDWYADTRRASDRWKVPIPVLLSIIHRESSFRATAKPVRRSILWFIPRRPRSSALGYSQALNATWASYQQATRQYDADRTRFDDAVDFVGWYVDRSWKKNGIAKHDAFHNYLAYYYGHGGYARGDNKGQARIMSAALSVQQQADLYTKQLAICQAALDARPPWWWPFGDSAPAPVNTQRIDLAPVRFR